MGVSCLEEAGHFLFAVADVHRRSKPHPPPPRALTEEQGLLQPQSLHYPHPVRSALSRASSHRFTSLDTVRHEQPNSSSISAAVRPRPTRRVAHRPARVANRARTGAIRASLLRKRPRPAPRIRTIMEDPPQPAQPPNPLLPPQREEPLQRRGGWRFDIYGGGGRVWGAGLVVGSAACCGGGFGIGSPLERVGGW